nr:hypothetical protein [uncultured archaeon]
MSHVADAARHFGGMNLEFGWVKKLFSTLPLIITEGTLGVGLVVLGTVLFLTQAIQSKLVEEPVTRELRSTLTLNDMIAPFAIMAIGITVSFLFFGSLMHYRYRKGNDRLNP